MNEALGVDIGGVIIDKVNDGTDTSFFSANFLQTTAVPGVFQALRRLVDERFGSQVYLVSKCGQRVQKRTLLWLAREDNNFYEQTGISPNHVWFCKQRHEKAGICQKLGITHFIDDRLEILGNLTTVENLYLFQPNGNEVRRFAHFLDRVRQIDIWDEILEELLVA